MPLGISLNTLSPPKQYLQVLDAHGIHFGVIAGISIYGLYNDYMLEELRRHRPPAGGRSMCCPTTERYILERMKQDGVVGARLQLTRRKELPDLGDEAHQLLLRRLADLDMHVPSCGRGAFMGPRCYRTLKPPA